MDKGEAGKPSALCPTRNAQDTRRPDEAAVFTGKLPSEPEGELKLTFQGNGLTPACAVVTLVEATCLVNTLCLLGGCNNHSVERG